MLVCVTATGSVAQIPRQITWDDLVPPSEPVVDPLAHLSFDIAVSVEQLVRYRAVIRESRLSDVSPEAERAVELEYELKRQGVDVEGLVRSYQLAEREIDRLNRLTVPSLEGQFVKIPGYALPLEFSEQAIQEFLLVPYVGACIHVPPPPQNQLVFVRLETPFVAKNIFEPVWVIGRMNVGKTEKTLFLTDGNSPIVSGYRMDRAKIEPYRE
tara:strand:- start:845 stop:1480 length:636 start_codon:yes stop_codon:yes gene_type:complete